MKSLKAFLNLKDYVRINQLEGARNLACTSHPRAADKQVLKEGAHPKPAGVILRTGYGLRETRLAAAQT